MFRIFVLSAAFILSVSGYALAHCGKCGVGEAHADAAMQEGESVCLLCNMKVNKETGFTAEYEGKTYYFCSQACADMFKGDPKAMLEKATAPTTK